MASHEILSMHCCHNPCNWTLRVLAALTDRCTINASCHPYPEVQDLPRRVVAHNVPTQGCHPRLIEGRPQLGPLACSISPTALSYPKS